MEAAKECWPAIWGITYTTLCNGVILGRASSVREIGFNVRGGRGLPNSNRMS
jgi:hypothetical protein